ncbi:MAG TPA: LysM peptidoglycan-binding domain-containing protein [Acidimicrobiia bacterium]|nr:LysM peptidoglycan-binding domain-containing protein [Acidimicrobiia bacterium]
MTTFVLDPRTPTRTQYPSQSRGPRYVVPPRLVAVLLVLSVLVVLTTAVQADQPVAVAVYTVESGDTLWSIAATATDHGDDVRDMVAAMRELNGLVGSTIHPGQVLHVPQG